MPLDLSPQQFEELAGRVVAASRDYLESLDARPVFPAGQGRAAVERFDLPLPEDGIGAAAFDDLADIADLSRPGNARFFGYVLGSGDPVAAVADLYASVLNQNVTAWRSGPASVTIERTVVRWLAEAVGCSGFTGSLVGGGSSANLMGLAMARESRLPANEAGALPGAVYVSSEAHMSMAKAAALLGLGRDNVRLVDVGADFRMRPDSLRAAIEADIAGGLPPVAVVATAGTTSTGAIDPLGETADVAAEHNLWLHVDGAYGGFAAIAAPEKFSGLDRADSVSLDAHKWLYQPVDASVVLYRDRDTARRTFSYTGEYARSLTDDPVEGFAFFDESFELSRRFRALKLWMSLRYHGLREFRAAITTDLRHARLLADLVDELADLELLAPVELSAVCFRWTGDDPARLEERNSAILRRVQERGRVYLSNARVGAAFALRACITNHRTTDDDIREVVEEVIAAAADT
jgi:glutamate/tyrosine decarboxylase-like PLP-dependent enzyme